jgi:hypothetical protein
MLASLFVLAAVVSGDVLPVDDALVQSAVVVELNGAGDVACPSAVDAKGQACGRGRRFELRGLDRTHALEWLNAAATNARSSCGKPPTHAVVFTTTKGVRSVDISFSCHAAGGRALPRTAEAGLVSLMRQSGLIHGLPVSR